ncbi:hypothetical protein FI667_g7999, partial [Globisporangium splendens]
MCFRLNRAELRKAVNTPPMMEGTECSAARRSPRRAGKSHSPFQHSLRRASPKKKVTLADMKAQERALTVSLQKLLTLFKQTPCLGKPTQQDELVDLLVQREALHAEQLSLRRRIDKYYRFHDAICEQLIYSIESRDNSTLRARDKNESESASHSSGREDVDQGSWVQFLTNEPPLYFVSYTEQECVAFANTTLERVYAFQLQNLRHGRGHSVALFDWVSSLIFERDHELQMQMMRFSFAKSFRNLPRSINELVTGEWRVLRAPDAFDSIFSVFINSQTLQIFAGDTLSVVVANPPVGRGEFKYRTMTIYSRGAYYDPEGRDEHTSPGEQVVYTHGRFIYTSYREGETPGDVNVDYGGRMQLVSEEAGQFFMVEVGSSLICMENLFSPFRVLTAGTASCDSQTRSSTEYASGRNDLSLRSPASHASTEAQYESRDDRGINLST